MIYRDIRNAAITTINSILSGYSELTNGFDLEQNTDRELSKGFAVFWGESHEADGPMRHVSYHANMIVAVTNSVAVRITDDVAPTIDSMYDDIETITKTFLNNEFLGIPSKIRGLKAPSLSAPILIYGDTIVKVTLTFPVSFTLPITYT